MSEFEYAPALESTSIVDIKDSYGLFINGKFAAPKSGKHFATINPATEEHLADISLAGLADVNAAVKAAREAYVKVWSKLPAAERGKYLYRIARILQERAREFAVLETLDNGKPIRETRDIDIPLAAAHFFYHAGWADKLEFAGVGTSPKPIGVAAQIIPWNFPLLMLAWKVAPALAAGNTIVLKPAETTPLTALLFAEVCQQAGLPAGVVNILTGDGSTGAHLVNHPGVDKIAFTGSTEVGKQIARAIADTNKRATLELGGKGANIVYDDAAIDEAVEGIVTGIFFNQGHVCCDGSRLLLQENIHDEVIEKLKTRISKIRMGNPLDRKPILVRLTRPPNLHASKSSVHTEMSRVQNAGHRNALFPNLVSGFPQPSSLASLKLTRSLEKRSLAQCSRSSPSAHLRRRLRRLITLHTASPLASGAIRAPRCSGLQSDFAQVSSGQIPSINLIQPVHLVAIKSRAGVAKAVAMASPRT